jgi:hypothetical protein
MLSMSLPSSGRGARRGVAFPPLGPADVLDNQLLTANFVRVIRYVIHESTILLSFLVIILRILILEVSTFVCAFLKNVIQKQIEFTSLMDCFV